MMAGGFLDIWSQHSPCQEILVELILATLVPAVFVRVILGLELSIRRIERKTAASVAEYFEMSFALEAIARQRAERAQLS